MDSAQERSSYCIGLDAGKRIGGQFTDIHIPSLCQGIEDGVTGKGARLPDSEIQKVLQLLQQQIGKQQRDYLMKLTEANRKAGEHYLEENSKKPGVVVLKSGLQYKIIQRGLEGRRPNLLDLVSMHYRGSFIDGTVFDSSYERGRPQDFPVNRMIPGWSEAVQLMSVGEKWLLAVPHYLAYGETGFGNEIAPCTALLFEIELLAIK